MSEKRLEIVRRSYDAFNRQDFDLALTYADPEIEYHPVDGQEPLEGLPAYRQWMEPDAFEDMLVTLQDIEASGDRVLVRQLVKARGAGSGIEIELMFFTVFSFTEDDLEPSAFRPSCHMRRLRHDWPPAWLPSATSFPQVGETPRMR